MIRHLCVLLILLAGLIVFEKDYISSDPFGYDEADYMFMTSQGWLSNYTDSPSQSITDFVRTGLARGKEGTHRRGLSEDIRASGDVAFYRHWHGPMYFYWLSALSTWNANEYPLRAASLIIPGIIIFMIYFGVLWIVPGYAGQWAAMLCAVLYAWSYSTLRSAELAPHQLYSSCYIGTLIVVTKAIETGGRRLWYGSVIGCAFAFCTLEIAFTLIATVMLCGYLERRRLGLTWRAALKSVLVFAGTVLVLWPAAVLKLNFLKAYAFMAYLALVRKSPWGQITFGQTWLQRFGESPVEWILIVVGAALFLRHRHWLLFPIVIYSVFTLLAVLRVNSDAPRYLLIFLPALLLIAGISIGFLLTRFRPGASAVCVALLGLVTAWNTHQQFARHPALGNRREWEVLAFIRDHGLEDKGLSVPQSEVPTIHYYFPRTRLHGYVDASELALAGPVDAILYGDDPVHFVLSPH
jgi:hypothetical protein